MRDLTTSPLFIRLGRRMRAPEGTPVGAIRRINISNVVVSQANAPYASIVAGLPEAPVEDVRIANLTVVHGGGGRAADLRRKIPEHADHYPEPSMFGITPAYGLYVRHAHNLSVHHADLRTAAREGRPPVVLHDVDGAGFEHVRFAHDAAASTFVLQDVRGFAAQDALGMRDVARANHTHAIF
jgi:hypothetical protein